MVALADVKHSMRVHAHSYALVILGLVVCISLALAPNPSPGGRGMVDPFSLASADCSSSRGQCTISLVSRLQSDINTTGEGTLSFNGQNHPLACGAVDIKPMAHATVSCSVQGNVPDIGSPFVASVWLSNGEYYGMLGNFSQ
jgi:hypothetical protein